MTEQASKSTLSIARKPTAGAKRTNRIFNNASAKTNENGKKKAFKKGFKKPFKKNKPAKVLPFAKVFHKKITQESYMARPQAQKAIDVLAKVAPERFNFDEPKIMAIGLMNELLALNNAKPEAERKVSNLSIRKALREYAQCPNYIKSYRVGAKRYDLQGNEAGEVEQGAVNNTQKSLNKLKVKFLKQAQAKAKAEKAKQSQGEQKAQSLADK